MKIKLAYSRDSELKPLIPLLEGRINNKGYELVAEKIKEDEIKFNIDKYELLYIPLPVISLVKDIRILSNGSYVINKLYIRRTNEDKVIKLLVDGTNSTEFYLAKMLTDMNIIPSFKDYNATIDYENGNIDLYEEWVKLCGNLPIIVSVLGSKILGDEDLLKIKTVIRDSASIAVNENNISSISKELGLKGRESLECFFKLCREKELCGDVKISLL